MKLYENDDIPYTRLDDDVSFQVLRTNPRLTTNTKLLYDGEKLFMEAYPAEPILATRPYKGCKVLSNGLYNNDIKNFIAGSGSSAYAVGQNMSDTILGDNFDYQFENMYWCGMESIASYTYPQEMGFIAPLYLRKKLPEYFVIFKVDAPSNTNLIESVNDMTYDFKEDIMKSARIIKTFDLREGTPIGNYIHNYVGQDGFKFDKSIYVNFSANEIYYYGIDRSTGVLTQRVNNIKEQMLDNDYTILRTDDWITSGFERNNLIFPYILNLEFLFDDDCEEYTFSRYFGMYCNAIDFQEIDVTGIGENNKVFVSWDDNQIQEYSENFDETTFYYIKDKYNRLYSIDKRLRVKGDINIEDCMGYELTSISTQVEKMEGFGYSTMILQITKVPDVSLCESIVVDIQDSDEKLLKRYETSSKLEKQSWTESGRFSPYGTKNDIAIALSSVIKNYPPIGYEWITSYAIGDFVFITTTFPGSGTNGAFKFICTGGCIKCVQDSFIGGTDAEGCLLKIHNEDKNLFERDKSGYKKRYIKCKGNKKNSCVEAIIPYVNDNEIDDEYSIVVTDMFGQNIRLSKENYVELVDDFYAKIGMLSFFPVKDFDFDTINSSYGNYNMMKKELDEMKSDMQSDSDIDKEKMSIDIPYGKFFGENGDVIETEYEYFCENIVPELCTVNKTVPFISKWGYEDDSKDSCECSYRLNTSKIFDTCNFSANTFMIDGDILEYTHSMPYYVVGNDKDENVDEYQYINDSHLWDYDNLGDWTGNDRIYDLQEYIDTWVKKFKDTTDNNFDKFFGDCSTTSKFKNKRFNKKYSRFLNGTKVNHSSTLFRGVKFELVEYDNGKEVKTSRYNGYKFSFIYIPVGNFSSRIYFVKNDVFKFIVGMVFFKVSTKEIPFGKANAYAGVLGFLDPYEDNKETTK